MTRPVDNPSEEEIIHKVLTIWLFWCIIAYKHKKTVVIMSKIEHALYYRQNLDRRQIKTKKAIIGAFIQLLQEKDISKITITELAKLANIDRKTFYLHYESISDLYNDLGNMAVALIKAEIIEFSSGNGSAYDFFSGINEIIREKIDLFKSIAKNNDFTDFMFMIKDILSNELTAIYGKESSNERLKLTAEFIASGTISMYLRWLKGDTGITMDELALIAAEMITGGAMGLINIL